jgi:CheY-like chemotaxis protein
VGGDETILLAEDEAGIRAMTRAYLEGLGYHVLEASNGAEAVRISDEYRGTIHLVLTDILMPILRGYAAVKAIREHRPNVKALYISGYSEENAADSGSEVLYKPFEFPELGRRLRSVLD